MDTKDAMETVLGGSETFRGYSMFCRAVTWRRALKARQWSENHQQDGISSSSICYFQIFIRRFLVTGIVLYDRGAAEPLFFVLVRLKVETVSSISAFRIDMQTSYG